ncbi:hypothetical protein [Salmonella phage NINP13076]|nr:hypothetical protein [Salmonella phage NINP13076]
MVCQVQVEHLGHQDRKACYQQSGNETDHRR